MERLREWGEGRQRVIELVNSGLPIARAATFASYSERGAREVIRAARKRGIEIRVCTSGRPPKNRGQILEKFNQAMDAGHLPTEAVIYAAKMASCSETTVYRARRGE